MAKTDPKVSPRSPSGVKWEQVKNNVDDNDNDDDDDDYDDGDDDNGFPWKQLTRSGKCGVIQLANCFQRDLSEAGGGH